MTKDRANLLALWALGWLFLIAYAVSLVTGVGGEFPRLALLMLTHTVGAAASVLGVVVSRPGARLPWALLAAAMLSFMGTATIHAVVPDAAVAFPSMYDAGLFAFYPIVFVALVLWLRQRVAQIRVTVWLDAAIGAVVLATIAAGALTPGLGDDPSRIVLGQLLYVLGDFALLGFLGAAYVLTGWRPGRSLLSLILGAAVLALGDGLYVLDVAAGTTTPSVLSAVCWPAGLLFFSAAGWQPVSPATTRRSQWAAVAIPSVAAIACIPLAALSASGAVSLLAGVAIALVVLRLVLSLIDNERLLGMLRLAVVTDSLTGLANHHSFHEALDRRLHDEPEIGFAVVLFDVDGFKRVNDEYGHVEGDRLLREVAHALRTSVRAEDCIARLGGDEFGVLVPGVEFPLAVSFAQRVQRAIETLDAGVGISFGVAEWPADGPTKEQLLFRADMALYSAKPGEGDRKRLKTAAALATASANDGGRQSADADMVSRVLASAREQLGMDVAYFSEFTAGQQVFRGFEGDAQSFGLQAGAGIPLEDTYCQRVVDGRLPSIIRDAGTDTRVSSLDVTHEASLGAYVGVPVRFSDGRLYGTLCCASHDPEPALAQRDAEFMQVLARLLGEQLEREEQESRERALEAQAVSVRGLLAALDARDHYTGEHSESVVELSRLVARHLRLSPVEVLEVEQVALLHDVGKIGIPDAVLQKEGPLSASEWCLMRQHPEIGARLVAAMKPLTHLAPKIRAEHERWDGGGYPDGLADTQIPLASRIILACDAYHAMTSDRPYRGAMPLGAARQELEHNAGTQFDPEVVDALLGVLDRQPVTVTAGLGVVASWTADVIWRS